MIDEKKLIEELNRQKYILTFEDSNPIDEGFNCGIDKAIQLVESQPKVGEWIPVEERLPKHSGEYLIQAINDYEGIYMAVSNYDSQYKSFSSDGVQDDNAIAWMDLPKMYEVKNERI